MCIGRTSSDIAISLCPQSSELCLRTLIIVFKEDRTGVPSLEIVRLLNRMVKERKFSVHPNALSCLLHLRLKSELGDVRASETKADKESRESRNKLDRKRAKGKKVEKPHLSKKAVKAMKEKKEIEEQMQEAEAEVDREERANLVCSHHISYHLSEISLRCFSKLRPSSFCLCFISVF